MFNTGTEVVILGSNVKRKSGPRIGSVGHICTNLPDVTGIACNNIGQNTYAYMRQCTILFHRFGYQKSKKLELQTVNILLPKIELHKKAELSLNKFINYTNNITRNRNKFRNAMVFAVSVNTSYDPNDKNRCIGTVVGAISNQEVRSVLTGFIGEDYKYAKVEYKHLENLITPNVIDLCVDITKTNNIKYTISVLSSQTDETLKQLLMLIRLIESLLKRKDKHKSGSKYPFFYGGHEALYKSMFIREDFLKISNTNPTITENIKEDIKNIRTLITNKAFDTLNFN